MAKANKKSLDAKAYINGQVNKFREDRRKTIDDVAKKQLVENFRETTSSEEYQEQLDIVHEDADVIRKETREKR
jgi:23S rRNA-/tRNA-specific pseudouridylate synthase